MGVISIYAPQSGTKRAELWGWVNDLVAEGNWAILDDMNMVEWIEDTNCDSPLLSEDEATVWSITRQDMDLVDCYTEAATRKGPRYTRVQVKRDTIEMSRLDRCYLTNSGEWINQVLMSWREKLERGNTEHTKEGYRTALTMLRDKDEQEARLWRLRSRSKWMAEGDALTKFFFAQ
ncbi:hypothetical protein R1sor_007151 [Riccia sorocarpa]|uniref:Uncharacterized protein n=1 Tax=Riccia sorocarpa TaxID=122646 RepID=A0ABD3HTU1_9MARC